MPARLPPMITCIAAIHHRFLFTMSTRGLHKGFMTQGRYNQLVYKAMSVLLTPMFLNMMTATVMTTT